MRKPAALIKRVVSLFIVCIQLLVVMATTFIGIMQPTPEMTQAVMAKSGLNGWVADATTRLTQELQPLWGTPKVAKAEAFDDPVALLSNN